MTRMLHIRLDALLTITLLVMTLQLVTMADAFAACSASIGKVTINEYNNLSSNNTLSSTFVEIKLLPVPVAPAAGAAPVTDVTGWSLKSYTKNNQLLDTKTVASASVGGCTGTDYRATPLTLNNAGDGYVHLFDNNGDLVDVLYVNVTPPTSVASCSLSTITTDKDIQGADSNRKDVSRIPDGTGDWVMSIGSGNNSEQTLCANNSDLLGTTKTASKTSLYVGETVTFTLTVTNKSQYNTLTNVHLVDTLPSGLTRTAYTVPTGSTFDAATNTWTIASLAPSASVTTTITAQATAVSAAMTNTAISDTLYSGLFYQSQPAAVSLQVLQPLSLAKSITPASIGYNATAVFTVSVTNNSTAPLPGGFTISDPFTLPAGLTAGTPAYTAGTTYTGGLWTISSGMPAGATYTLTLPVTSHTTALTYTNTATANAPFGGLNLSASATLTVTANQAAGFNAFESTTAANATTGKIYTKVAGSGFNLDVVAISMSNTQLTTFSNNVQIELLANSAAPGTGYGTDNCPTSNSIVQTIASAAISGGRSTVSFAAVNNVYRDVRVRITYASVTPAVVACSTDSFAIRPATLLVAASDSNWTTAGTANVLSNTSASGGVLHKAGQPFTLKATARDSAGNTTSNYIAPATMNSALSTCVGTGCTTGFGTVTLGTATVTSGVVTWSGASYSEVGAFNLTLQDQLFAQIDSGDGTAADCSGRYLCSAATAVGRFVPDHFAVSAPLLTNRSDYTSCSSTFTYLGEPLKASFTLTAQGAANNTTQNYTGTLAKLDLTAPANLSFAAIDQATPATLLTSRMSVASSSGSWTNGVADAFVTLTFAKSATSADGPFKSVAIGVAPMDGDNVTLASAALNLDSDNNGSNDRYKLAATTLYHGRLALTGTCGTTNSSLPMALAVQYYDSSNGSFVNNSGDHCTTTSVALNPNPNGSCVWDNPTTPLSGSNACATAAPAGKAFTEPPTNGLFNLWLKGGGAAVVGVTASMQTGASYGYLQYPWSGATASDTTRNATFGIFCRDNTIYTRDNY